MTNNIKIKIETEFILDLARKYANACEFKSDFPHDWNSVNDGFIEGFKAAINLIETNNNTMSKFPENFDKKHWQQH